MRMSTPEVFSLPDLSAVILQIVKTASTPLTADAIYQNLPGGYFLKNKDVIKILQSETASGRLFHWQPGPRSRKERFWHQEESGYIQERILASLTAQPLTRQALLEKMKKNAVSYAGTTLAKLINTTVESLVKGKTLHLLPPSGRYRSLRYSRIPADPRNYLSAVRKEFERACRRLKKTGLTPEDILTALMDMTGFSLSLHPPGTLSTSKPEEVLSDALLNTVLASIAQLDPKALHQAPIWIPDLRQYLKLPKATFDRAILALAERGKVFLNRHAHPAQMTDAEKETMIPDGQEGYYVVVVLRRI